MNLKGTRIAAHDQIFPAIIVQITDSQRTNVVEGQTVHGLKQGNVHRRDNLELSLGITPENVNRVGNRSTLVIITAYNPQLIEETIAVDILDDASLFWRGLSIKCRGRCSQGTR